MAQKGDKRKNYARLKTWREQNPDKLAVQRERYRERSKILGKLRYRKNKDSVLVRQNEWQREDYAVNQAKYLIRGAKRRSKQRKLDFDLEAYVTDIQNVISNGFCELTGLPFVTERGKQGPYAPSLDRKSPKDGYTKNNTRVVIWALNRAMGEWGFELLKTIVDAAHAKLRQEAR